jgi:Kef-type K+ transport system membrane component KefB
VFGAGIELAPRRFAHQTQAVLWVALVQFVVVGFVGLWVARGLGYADMASIYMGFGISASSTLVVIRHLRAQQQMFTPFGRLVTGVLLVQDIALIALISALAAGPSPREDVLIALGGLVVLGGAATAMHLWVLPLLTRRLQSDDETLLLVGLATLCGFIAAAYWLGLPFIAGAFLAGFALASFPASALMRGLIGSVSDFFQALFFTALGALLVVPTAAVFWHAMVFAVLVFVLTPPVVTFVAERCGQNARSGIESGLLLAQTSELSIIFALAGVQFGHIGMADFTTIAIVATITMSITPLFATDAVTWKLLHLHPARRGKPPSLDLRDHILVLGFGGAGMWVVKPLLAKGHRVLVVDDDPAVIESLSHTKVECWRGDGSDERTLEAVHARDARLIIAALPRLADLLKIIRHVRGVRVIARVFEESEARAVERAGGIPILNSEAGATQFFEWFANFKKPAPSGDKRKN